MRSIAEIDADIAEVQKRIEARNEGTPLRNSPEYRAARFDYIVDGDRSGLDAYQNALNAAIQNKLSRDAQERMLKEGKQQADDEQMDQWQKDYSFAKSAREEINANPKSTPKQKEDAEATVRYYEAVGAKKGYMKKYADMTKAPEAPKVETPAAPAQPAGESFKQLMARGQTLEKDEDLDAWIEDVKKYTGNDAVVGEAYEGIGKAQEKKKANADARWNEYNSRVKAALGEKDYKKRKDALEPLKEELGNYKGQEKYAEVEKSINDGLKKPVADPLTRAVVRQHFSKNDITALKSEIDKSKDKGITKNIPVGGRNRILTFKTDKDGNVLILNEKGREVDKFTKRELAEFDTSSKTEIPDTPRVNPVAKSLAGESKFPNGRVIVGPGEDW